MVCAAIAAEREGIPVGPGFFYPEAGLSLSYDDNLLNQETDTVDSMVTTASVSGREEIYGEASRYAVELGLNKGWYHSSPQDNYLDGRLFGEIDYFPTERFSTLVKGGYWRLHEGRGTTVFQGDQADLQEEPDKFDLWWLNGTLSFGVDQIGAPKLELRAGYRIREYVNNRSITEFRDRNEAILGATLKYMIMPATSLVLDGQYTKFEYDRNEFQFDSHEYQLLAGVTWEATAATSGFAKVGWLDKSFDTGDRGDGSVFAWELGVDWSPLTYSTFELSTSRSFVESNGTGDFIDRKTVELSWKHEWKQYLSSTLYLNSTRESYKGVERDDDIIGAGASVDYSMTENLKWQVYYDYRDRDSSVEVGGLDYSRNQIGLRLNYSL